MAAVQEKSDGTPVGGRGKMRYYFKCPSCGSDAEFTVPREESSGLGFPLLVIYGFIAALLYADATSGRVQCSKCGYIFRQPSLPRTAVSALAVWIIGIILVFGFLAVLVMGFPEIMDLLPQSHILAAIEQLISENPRAVLLGSVCTIAAVVLILVVSLIASWASNHRAHAELRKKFETEPKQCDVETKRDLTMVD